MPDGRHAFSFFVGLWAYHRRVRAAAILRRGLVPSLLLAAASVGAETRPLSLDPVAASLAPGSLQETAWDAGASDLSFEEAELVLSLDGGRTFPIRLSAEIEPGETRAEWRVPSLPTAHARLALRVGREGVSDAERIVRMSAEFTILVDPSLPPEPIFRFAGEWRTREALAPPSPRAPLTAYAPPAVRSALGDADESADAPRPDSLAAPLLESVEAASAPADAPVGRADVPHGFDSASAPLRL